MIRSIQARDALIARRRIGIDVQDSSRAFFTVTGYP